MKKILVSISTIAIVAAVGFGATRAYFTSTATSTNNAFTAGTLVVDVNGSSANTDQSFTMGLNTTGDKQPGDILTNGQNGFATITVKNTGSLPMATFGRFTLDSNDNALSHDMVFTDYKVEFYNADQSKKARVDDFIENGVVKVAGMKANVYEWVTGYGPMDIMAGPDWDVEGLRSGEYFVITYKIQYDPAATVQGRTAKLGYQVLGSQVNSDAMKALSAATGVDAETLGNPTWGMYYYVGHQQLGLY